VYTHVHLRNTITKSNFLAVKQPTHFLQTLESKFTYFEVSTQIKFDIAKHLVVL